MTQTCQSPSVFSISSYMAILPAVYAHSDNETFADTNIFPLQLIALLKREKRRDQYLVF